VSLKQQVVKSIGWLAVSQIGSQILRVVTTLILVRLLLPEAFGTIAMILVLTNFSTQLINFGFASAIIQKKNLTNLDSSSVFWLNVLVGTIITLLIILFSGQIALFYEKPILKPLAIFLAFIYFLGSLSLVHRALLEKNLKFEVLAKIDLLTFLGSGIIAITLAKLGYGVWSVAFQEFTIVLIPTLLLWIGSKWRPNFSFSLHSIKSMFGLSASLFFNSFLAYVSNNLDNMLIGKHFGDQSLGIYSKSFSFIGIPGRLITAVLSKVMFPLFSIIQDNLKKIKSIFLDLYFLVSFISFPLMIYVYSIAEHFTLVFFGENWIGMIPFVKIFSILSMISSLNSISGILFMSQGRADIILKAGVIKRGIIISSILIGLQFGFMGIAICRLGAEFLNLFVSFFFIDKILNISILKQFGNILYPIISSCCIALGLYFLTTYMISNINVFIIIILSFLTAILIHVVIGSLFFPLRITQMKGHINRLIKK